MRKFVVACLLIAALAAPRAWALFGSNPLAARESTQIANRTQIKSRLKLQIQQYTTQLEQWRKQKDLLDLEKAMGMKLDFSDLSDPLAHLDDLRSGFDVDASVAKVLAHKTPAQLKALPENITLFAATNATARIRQAADRKIATTRNYASITAARLKALEAEATALKTLLDRNASASGTTQAQQTAAELNALLSSSTIQWRQEQVLHAQWLAEKAAEEAALEAYRAEARRRYFARARAAAAAMKTDPDPEF